VTDLGCFIHHDIAFRAVPQLNVAGLAIREGVEGYLLIAVGATAS